MNHSKAIKILIIDDSELVGEKVGEMLLTIPSVELLPLAKTVTEGLDRCAEKNPHIIFLDFNLPGGNGIEVLKSLKLHQPKIKVVMLTNTTSIYHKQKFKQLGGDVFLDKTRDFTKIVDIVYSLSENL